MKWAGNVARMKEIKNACKRWEKLRSGDHL